MPNLIDQLKELDAKRTKGVWRCPDADAPHRVSLFDATSHQWRGAIAFDAGDYARSKEEGIANAAFIAATANALPKLIEAVEALKGLRGLVQLLLGRNDLSPQLREALIASHRVEAADAALKALEQET